MNSALKLFVVTLVSTIALLSLSGCASSGASQIVGKPAPFARFNQLEDGALFTTEQFKGKTLVIAFWATTCRSSNPNMKRISEYAANFKGRNDVAFIGVSIDKAEDIDAVKERIKYDGFGTLINMYSGNDVYDEAYQAFKGDRLPYFIVVDRFGNVVDAQYDDDFVYDLVKTNAPMPMAKIKRDR